MRQVSGLVVEGCDDLILQLDLRAANLSGLATVVRHSGQVRSRHARDV